MAPRSHLIPTLGGGLFAKPLAGLVAALLVGLLASGGLSGDPGRPATRGATSAPEAAPRASTVLLVSVDGLNPSALTRLGRTGAPHLTRLLATGTGTTNARTAVESRQTLPNHVSIVTGRRIAASDGGHGVLWNDARRSPATVAAAAGEPVASVFSVVQEAGLSSALFAAKEKFALFERSWPAAVDRSRTSSSDTIVVREARADLRQHRRALRLVHLAAPDKVGHRHGFMGPEYLAAVRRTDQRLGQLFAALRAAPDGGRAAVVLTSDHGGAGSNHVARTVANSRVLLVARGPGVARGANLYALDPTLVSPGRSLPGYGVTRSPARNLHAGPLALQLLGLGPIPGSEPEAALRLRLS